MRPLITSISAPDAATPARAVRELKTDCRPACERMPAGRYQEPTFLDLKRETSKNNLYNKWPMFGSDKLCYRRQSARSELAAALFQLTAIYAV
jgi:hypothetical protein